MPRKKSRPRQCLMPTSVHDIASPQRFVLRWAMEWDMLPMPSSTTMNTPLPLHDVESNTETEVEWMQHDLDRCVEEPWRYLAILQGGKDDDNDDSSRSSPRHDKDNRNDNNDCSRSSSSHDNQSGIVEPSILNNDKKRSLSWSPNGRSPNKRPRPSGSSHHPKIGPDHQVTHLPLAGSYATPTTDGDDNTHDQLEWDPSRATPEVWEWLSTLQCRILAHRALHESDYQVPAAKAWLVRNKQSLVEPKVDEQVFFEIFAGSSSLVEREQFHTIAKTLGVSTWQVVQHFERWSGHSSDLGESDTEQAKEEVLNESDICAFCKDGGYLMVCSGDCGKAFHSICLNLDTVPKGDWYCSQCEPTGSAWKGSIKCINLDTKHYLLIVPTTPGKGLGLDVAETKDRKTSLEYVRRHDTPARFHSGDIIVAVNTESTQGLQYKAVVQKLKAASWRDAVSLELQRLAPLESDTKLPAHPPRLASKTLPAEPKVNVVGPTMYELRVPLCIIFCGLNLIEKDEQVFIRDFHFPALKGLPRIGDRLIAVNGSVLFRGSLNEVLSLIGTAAKAPEQVLLFERTIRRAPTQDLQPPFQHAPVKVLSPTTYEICLPLAWIFNGIDLVQRQNELVVKQMAEDLHRSGLRPGDRLLFADGTRVANGSLNQVAASMGKVAWSARHVMQFERTNGADLSLHGLVGGLPDAVGDVAPIEVRFVGCGLYETHIPVGKARLGANVMKRTSDGRTVLERFSRKISDPDQVCPAKGDVMVEVDGTNLGSKSFAQVVALLKNNQNFQKRVILWQRGSQSTPGLPSASDIVRSPVGHETGESTKSFQDGTATNPIDLVNGHA